MEKIIKRIALATFFIYIILLLRLAVFRDDFLKHGLFENGTLNLVPFALYVRFLRAHAYRFAFLQFVGNIGWFVPLGFFLPYLTGKPEKLGLMLVFGSLLSVIIELSQWAFGTGVTELDDLLLNTFGAAIGFWLFRLFLYFTKRKNKKKEV